MFQGTKSGWEIIKESIKVFNRHPKLLIPLLITWLIYAPLILYVEYGIQWDRYTSLETLTIVFCVIFILAFCLSFACSVLLELIQQHESEEDMSLWKALVYTIGHNLVRLLPVVLLWTIIWFILLLIQVILSKSKAKGDNEEISTENAAKTLAGYGTFSFSKAFFEALQKGVRMVTFLILPAIAWEGLSFPKAIKKGLTVFRTHLSVFVSGFLLTSLVAFIVFLPVSLVIMASEKFEIVVPAWGWMVTIIYTGFAWSYSIYLEQMFIAELYLWNYKWEKEVAKAQLENRPWPTLDQVARPSILDEVPELMKR